MWPTAGKRSGSATCSTGSDWKRHLKRYFRAQEKNGTRRSVSAETAPPARKNLLDLRGVCCPMNFVKAKLAMEKIRGGETIEIYLDDGEPIVNVTRSLKDEGHQVLLVTPKADYFEVMVEKK